MKVQVGMPLRKFEVPSKRSLIWVLIKVHLAMKKTCEKNFHYQLILTTIKDVDDNVFLFSCAILSNCFTAIKIYTFFHPEHPK